MSYPAFVYLFVRLLATSRKTTDQIFLKILSNTCRFLYEQGIKHDWILEVIVIWITQIRKVKKN